MSSPDERRGLPRLARSTMEDRILYGGRRLRQEDDACVLPRPQVRSRPVRAPRARGLADVSVRILEVEIAVPVFLVSQRTLEDLDALRLQEPRGGVHVPRGAEPQREG